MPEGYLQRFRDEASHVFSYLGLNRTYGFRDILWAPLLLKQDLGRKKVEGQGTFVFTIDVETANDFIHTTNDIGAAKAWGANIRKGINDLIEIGEANYIPFTWFCTGHVLLDSCQGHSPFTFPWASKKNGFSDYWVTRDWYIHDPQSNYKTNPEWYFGDLVERIQSSEVNHEIGCHTFTHPRCDLISFEALEKDIRLYSEVVRDLRINPESFAYPWDKVGHFNLVKESGFRFARIRETEKIVAPRKEDGLVVIYESLSGFLSPSLIIYGINLAVKYSGTFVWLIHPWEVRDEVGKRILLKSLRHVKHLQENGDIIVKTVNTIWGR